MLCTGDADTDHAAEAEDHRDDLEAGDRLAEHKVAKNGGPERSGLKNRAHDNEGHHWNTENDSDVAAEVNYAAQDHRATVSALYMERLARGNNQSAAEN